MFAWKIQLRGSLLSSSRIFWTPLRRDASFLGSLTKSARFSRVKAPFDCAARAARAAGRGGGSADIVPARAASKDATARSAAARTALPRGFPDWRIGWLLRCDSLAWVVGGRHGTPIG